MACLPLYHSHTLRIAFRKPLLTICKHNRATPSAHPSNRKSVSKQTIYLSFRIRCPPDFPVPPNIFNLLYYFTNIIRTVYRYRYLNSFLFFLKFFCHAVGSLILPTHAGGTIRKHERWTGMRHTVHWNPSTQSSRIPPYAIQNTEGSNL